MSESRFYIEHGVVHDRKTGKHLVGCYYTDEDPDRLLSVLRELETDYDAWRMPAAPAADGAGELPPLPEPTCLGFRNPCGITQLPDMGIYGYTSDQMHAYARAAIAALRQPVPDAVRELADEWRGRIAVAYDEYSHGQRAGYQVAAADLDRALASQQESRND